MVSKLEKGIINCSFWKIVVFPLELKSRNFKRKNKTFSFSPHQ